MSFCQIVISLEAKGVKSEFCAAESFNIRVREALKELATTRVVKLRLAWNPLLKQTLAWKPKQKTIRHTLVRNQSPERGSQLSWVTQPQSGRVVPRPGHILQE